MSYHHNLHPLGRKYTCHEHGHEHASTESHTSAWLLELLKKVLQAQPDERSIITGNFTCPEASYFNQKINACRKVSGATPVNEHEHHPKFTKKERNVAVKEIAQEIHKRMDTYPLAIVSKKPNEIIYGNADNPDGQVIYTFKNGHWLITTGKNVDAIIIDPAGKVIEIKPGPHIHQYGDGGNLVVAGASKSHHEEHGHRHGHRHGHGHGHSHDHNNHHNEGPCSNACGHGAKSHEHHHHKHGHKHGSSCSLSNY
ncbi:MAG: hypothetical protein IPP74_02365 [Alphaproteobacteria bacterium]|nr:hypothetical protein [Alphaproteobacteria bacterium]